MGEVATCSTCDLASQSIPKSTSWEGILSFALFYNVFPFFGQHACRAPLFEECPQHYGHKGDPGVILGTCGTIGERAQVILV